MTTLMKHDVTKTKLENERFDFLLHCNTCGWEGRGLDGLPPTADEMIDRHVGFQAFQDSGMGPVIDEAKKAAHQTKDVKDFEKQFDEKAKGLKKPEAPTFPLSQVEAPDSPPPKPPASAAGAGKPDSPAQEQSSKKTKGENY